MPAYPGKNRRRNMLSMPSVHLRIILLFAVLALLYAAVNIYISKNAFEKLAAGALSLPLSPITHRDLQIIVYEQGATLDLQLSLFTFLSFCMLCLAGVLMSHRLGGPIFHLKHYMDGLATGAHKPRKIQFRRHDFFHDLADAFNRFQEREGILKQDDRPPAGSP